jgi:hypothetical protein
VSTETPRGRADARWLSAPAVRRQSSAHACRSAHVHACPLGQRLLRQAGGRAQRLEQSAKEGAWAVWTVLVVSGPDPRGLAA